MNCKKANKQISLLIDGRLAEKDRSALIEHINVCAGCESHYNQMKDLVAKLGGLPEIPLPEGAENRIHFALKNEAERPKKKKWVKFAVIAMPATAAVFAAVLGISYLFSGGLTKTANDMSVMEMAPAMEEGAMQKSVYSENAADALEAESPKMAQQDTAAADSEEESRSVPAPLSEAVPSVEVVFTGEDPDEMKAFAESLAASLGVDTRQEAVFDAETGSISIALPRERYQEFTDIVESTQNLAFGEGAQWDDGASGESLLFEVNFLFQKNN